MKKLIIIFFTIILLASLISNAQSFEPSDQFEQKVNALRAEKGRAPIEFLSVNCDSILLSSVRYYTEHLTIKGHAQGKYNQWFGWSKCEMPRITDDLLSASITTASISVARYHYDTYVMYEDGEEEFEKRDTYYAIVVVWD